MNAPSFARRAVITGLGAVTPIGIGKDALWQSLLEGRSGIDLVRAFDASPFHAPCSAELTGFDARDWFPPHRLKRLDRFAQISVVAAKLAIEDAGLHFDPDHPHARAGTSFGTALGGIAGAEAQHARFLEKGAKAVNRALAFQVFGGSAHTNVAIEFGLQGIGTTNTNSCAAGNVAIADAARFILEDRADIIVAGGAEAPLCPLIYAAFDNINTMSRARLDPPALACRPFDRRRDGFVMAESAATVIVEEYGHARQRGAHIYGEILGFSLNNDAYHMTTPRPDGRPLVRAMSEALAHARLNPLEIDHINAHASSTQANDTNEARCIQEVFGSRRDHPNLTVIGTKSAHGHSLGAAGAVEAVVSLLAMHHQFAPPTLHLDESEDEFDLDFVPHAGREQKIDRVLNNSFGFGGINSCLVMGKV